MAISIREQTPGLAYMLAHCGAKVLVHDADLTDRLPGADDVPQLSHCIPVTPGAPCGELGLVTGSVAIREPDGGDEEDTAIILYTSGTTGKPKGLHDPDAPAQGRARADRPRWSSRSI